MIGKKLLTFKIPTGLISKELVVFKILILGPIA